MNVYDMSNKQLVELYELALKGKKYHLSLDQDMQLLEVYNECFGRQDESMNNHMYNHLVEHMREEMTNRFIDNVSYNN